MFFSGMASTLLFHCHRLPNLFFVNLNHKDSCFIKPLLFSSKEDWFLGLKIIHYKRHQHMQRSFHSENWFQFQCNNTCFDIKNYILLSLLQFFASVILSEKLKIYAPRQSYIYGLPLNQDIFKVKFYCLDG